MSDPVDTAAPWTIKSVGTSTREAVTMAARQEGLTVGQWLDKRVAEWLTDGSPVHVAPAAGKSTGPRPSSAEALEMLANMGRANIPVQKGVGTLANRLVKRELGRVLDATPPAPPRKQLAPPAAT